MRSTLTVHAYQNQEMEIISKSLSQFRKQTAKKGECTIKYWACQSPKTRHPQHSRSKYYILMMTSSAKLRDKKSPYRPINRRILINKMMKHNLIIIEGFFFIEDTSWSLKKYFFYNAWLASCPFLRKKNSFGVVKKWGEENIR